MSITLKEAQDFYGIDTGEILTIEKLEKKFRALRNIYHPDKRSTGNHETFIYVEDCFNLLKNTLQRQHYLTPRDLVKITESKMKEEVKPKKEAPAGSSVKKMTEQFKRANIIPRQYTMTPKEPRIKMTNEEIVELVQTKKKIKEEKLKKKMESKGIVRHTKFVNIDPFATSTVFASTFNPKGESNGVNVFNPFEYEVFKPKQETSSESEDSE